MQRVSVGVKNGGGEASERALEVVQGRDGGGLDEHSDGKGEKQRDATALRCGDLGYDWNEGRLGRIPRVEVGAPDGHVGLGGGGLGQGGEKWLWQERRTWDTLGSGFGDDQAAGV